MKILFLFHIMKTLDDDDVVVSNGYIYARLLLLLDIIMIIDSSALGWTGKTPWKQTTGCDRAPFFLFLQLAVRGGGVVRRRRRRASQSSPPTSARLFHWCWPPSTTFFYITAAAGRSRWRVNLDEAKKEEAEKKVDTGIWWKTILCTARGAARRWLLLPSLIAISESTCHFFLYT